MEIVEAELTNEVSLANAVAGSTYVVHVASPITGVSGAEEIITPAVNGTMAICRACQANGVRRLVITSSTGAV